MTTKKPIKKTETKVVTKPVVKKVKTPKFKLLTYTIKAVIPTGMYANIQPEVTVQAETIEIAERAVMPHIEALFAKYREGGSGGPQTPKPVVVATNVAPASKVAPLTPTTNTGPTPGISSASPLTPTTNTGPTPGISSASPAPVITPEPAIVMTVPFTRAKSAIDSCMSLEALALVETQIDKSAKLIADEKQQLATAILFKRKSLSNLK